MAEDHFKVRRYEKSDRQKYMEHNFASALGGPESVMKFSPQRLESPPPKPPRRRYSDQLSVQSLGNYYSLKKTNENLRNDSKLKRYNLKPAYLSLPANLTSNAVNELDDTSDFLSPSISNQLKHLKENELYTKSLLDNVKICPKQSYASNKFSSTEKSQSIILEADSNHISLKCQRECLAPSTLDKFSRNSLSNSKIFMTNTHIKENLKSSHKECHRRHHSDPAISNFNLQSVSVKCSLEQCCNNILYPANKANKYCDSTGSCCKKSYFLMQEMKILKEINDKLWHHLCSLQTCLENSRKKAYDECADISISGLLSNIYYAQKTKDLAMEERLKLALEERDAAVHELDLIHTLSKRFDCADAEKEVDKGMKELLGEMESVMNPFKFLKYQRLLLNQIQRFKEFKQECLSQKLKETVVERDNALEKIKSLEDEVKDLKLCYDLWHADNKHWEFTMFDIINQVIHQRDALLSKVDNGFEISSVICRPLATNKLDSIEYQNISHESRSKTIESLKNHQTVNLSDKHQHSYSGSGEIIKEEVLLLNKALEGERKKREHAEEKCLRLERLIHILRKKLNGQNVGVPV